MKAVADHFDTYLRAFAKPPIVMGQSFGGFFAELMAYRELRRRGRPHVTGGVPVWEAVADYALDWALNPIATAPQTVP